MNVKELLRGIVVVIDDEIEDDSTDIGRILSTLKEDKFPIVTYKDIPDEEVIQSLSSASMVILDWDFKNRKTIGDMGDMTIDEISRFKIGEQSNSVISFIKSLLNKIFVPIFIFTYEDTTEIETALIKDNLKEQIGKRIFIKHKNDLKGENLYTEIENWLKNNPSAYVVKEWDKIAIKNRDDMFLDFYNSDADWVPILWKALAADSDSLNTHNELGDFITKNFCNRFHSYNFEEKYTNKTIEKTDGLFKVLKHDAYIEYNPSKLPDIAYTGDVFKVSGKYYINLRAQCDISRKEKRGTEEEYNPELYLIKGVAEKNCKNIITNIVSIDPEGKIVIGNDDPISIEEILDNGYDEYNNKIIYCINNKHCFYNGALLERKDSVLLPYIVKDKVCKFNVNKIEIKKYSEIKDKRIGRIVSPYLTIIQQKVAHYIIRQGLMPIPEEIYFN